MQPSDRALVDELRREAALVRVPEDMWDRISERLDLELGAAERRRQSMRKLQAKSRLALVAAAGVLWLTVVPFHTAVRVPASVSSSVAAVSVSEGDDYLAVGRGYRRAEQRTQWTGSVAEDLAPGNLMFFNTIRSH